MRHARQASTEGGTAGEPSGAMVRVDLHAHSRASSKGATRWLDALGAAECYSGPERVYDLALARGMGFVAITDHDTIAGAWELVERGFDRVIVGEEVTTRLCQTGCLLHILVWSMTPELHEEIARLGLRDDAEALAHWLGRHRLPHALAHPLFGLNGRLTAETLQRCALLFGGFEAINAGHSTSRHRRALGRFLASLTADRLSAWSVMFNTRPIWPARWLTAGSDDHALLNLARAWTEAPGARTAPEFFRSLMQGRASIGGSDATTETLAHQFVGVASSFVRKRAASAQRQAPNRADQSKAVDRLVLHARSAIASSRPLAAAFRLARRPSLNSDDDHRRLDGLLRAAAAAGVQQMRRALESLSE